MRGEPSAENVRCQKCLEKGHWTYQCTGKRKYVYRPSRTKEMIKRMKEDEDKTKLELVAKTSTILEKKKKKKKSDGESSSSDSDSDSSSSSDSDSDGNSSSSSSSSGGSSSSNKGAWRVVLGAGFLRVCPVQPYFLRRISLATGSYPARFHSSPFRIFSGHRMVKMRLRQCARPPVRPPLIS
nr:hypothetical protein BaRGS_033638 [Batillaria attramentaria]